MLRMSGFAVQSYASGTDFLEMVDGTVSGCVILDLNMPDPGGLHVQKALANRKNVMPVIILTASGDVARAVQAMRAGAVDFLAKPIEKRPEERRVGNKCVCTFRAWCSLYL